MMDQDSTSRMSLDLDYDDPFATEVSADMIIARSRKAHRRSRVGLAAGVCAVAVVLAWLSSGVTGWFGRGTDVGGDLASALAATGEYAAHMPDGEPVVVDSSVAGWASVVWLSVDGQLCAGTVGVAGSARGSEAFNCWHVGGEAMFPAGAAPVRLPAFEALPTPADSGGKVLVIGLARADVATVDIEFHAHRVSAVVYPVTPGTGTAFGAYAAWLPVDGATSYGTADITSLVARDAADKVLGNADQPVSGK